METKLKGRVALDTGASQGIGESIARALHQEGAKVGLLARDGAKLSKVADSLGNARQFRRLCCERPPSTQRQEVLPMQGPTVVPAFLKEISRRIHEEDDDREARKVRNARAYIARVTASGHRTTHNERRWVAHCAQIIRQYEHRVADATDATKRVAACGPAG